MVFRKLALSGQHPLAKIICLHLEKLYKAIFHRENIKLQHESRIASRGSISRQLRRDYGFAPLLEMELRPAAGALKDGATPAGH